MNITTVTIQHLNHFAKIQQVFADLGMEINTIQGDTSNTNGYFGKYDVCARKNDGALTMYKIDFYGECIPEEGMYYL